VKVKGFIKLLEEDGGDFLTEWHKPVRDRSLENGRHLLRLAIDTHFITSHFALPLLIKKSGGLVGELTDATAEYNNTHYRDTDRLIRLNKSLVSN
jgi:hypothetical protein